MYTYTIMPDYGNAAYAWIRKPGAVGPGVGGNIADGGTGWMGKHPISKELETDFAMWAIEFEGEVTDETELTFHWQDFHNRGLALARRLKTELGPDVRVIYEKPIEDPDCAIEERREILPDGKLLRLKERRKRTFQKEL